MEGDFFMYNHKEGHAGMHYNDTAAQQCRQVQKADGKRVEVW